MTDTKIPMVLQVRLGAVPGPTRAASQHRPWSPPPLASGHQVLAKEFGALGELGKVVARSDRNQAHSESLRVALWQLSVFGLHL